MTKRLDLPRRNASDDDVRAITVFPDFIVHVRDTDENEIVLEVKKPGESLEYDELKLLAFRDQLGYRHCGHLIIGRDTHGGIVHDIRWV